MTKKRIEQHLSAKLNDWIESIPSNRLNVRDALKGSMFVSGGCITSLLHNETPNDYDIYFKDALSCFTVVEYYTKILDKDLEYMQKPIQLAYDSDRVKATIDPSFYGKRVKGEIKEKLTKGAKYYPVYITSNAITLSDGIQIIIRFCGDIDFVHSKFDFIHTRCSYIYSEQKVNLHPGSLESILTKHLKYTGSVYPLCSIIRTRKFIERGWFIDAGQYLKMVMQLNELDLKNLSILEEQLVGVDSVYFDKILEEARGSTNNKNISTDDLIKLIDKVF